MLGLLISIAVSRYQFFGRESISFVILLPIALPGIVTGMALVDDVRVAGRPARASSR